MDELRHREVHITNLKITELLKRQREDLNPRSLTSKFKFLTMILYISGQMEIWFKIKIINLKTCHIREELVLFCAVSQDKLGPLGSSLKMAHFCFPWGRNIKQSYPKIEQVSLLEQKAPALSHSNRSKMTMSLDSYRGVIFWRHIPSYQKKLY